MFLFIGVEVAVPEILVEELVDLRFAYANLLMCLERELEGSSEAQEAFIALLGNVLPEAVCSDCKFPSAFKVLTKKLSLFNIYYLKRVSKFLPEEVR